jgi:predicted GIY-YIG superfamily endonuclease
MSRYGIIGVYIIKAPNSWNCYVGSSINIIQRWASHNSQMQRGIHHSPIMQAAWENMEIL